MSITSIIFRNAVAAPGSGTLRTSWQALNGASAQAVGGTIHLKHASFPGVVVVVPLTNVDYLVTVELPEPQHLPEPTKAAGGKKGARKTDPKPT